MADHARVLSELCQAMAAQSGVLLLADADGALQPVATFGRPPGAAGEFADPLGRIFRRHGDDDQRLIVPVPDANGGVVVLERIGRNAFSRDDVALVRVHARQLADTLVAAARTPQRFDDDDHTILQLLSEHAAAAIENARQLSARAELVDELAALLEISQASSGASDETALARTLAAKMRAASRTDACVISRWEDNSTLLAPLAEDGMDGATGITDIAEFPATWDVLRSGQPRVVHAESLDDAVAEARALTEMGGHTLLMLPLAVGGKQIGLVELISLRARRDFDSDEMKVYQTMASAAAAGLENARLLEQLRRAADIDQVTGVHNHRYLHDRLRQEVARAARSGSPLCVLMLDLDNFKPINDRFGHADGDRVLRNVASTLRSVVRTNDIVARYGGDEFVVVLPDTPPDRAQEVARRVIVGIRERRHDMSDGTQSRVGVSGGLAVFPDNGRTATLLLQAADAAMYSAKRARAARSDVPVAGATAPEPATVPIERDASIAADTVPLPIERDASVIQRGVSVIERDLPAVLQPIPTPAGG